MNTSNTNCWFLAHLPHQQTRPGPAATLAPKTRTHPGPHSRLLPCPGAVAHPPTMDGRLRAGDCATQTTRRNGRNPIPRRGASHRDRQRYTPTHRQPTRAAPGHPAAENGAACAQQTKVDLKCSGENRRKSSNFLDKTNIMCRNCGRWAKGSVIKYILYLAGFSRALGPLKLAESAY